MNHLHDYDKIVSSLCEDLFANGRIKDWKIVHKNQRWKSSLRERIKINVDACRILCYCIYNQEWQMSSYSSGCLIVEEAIKLVVYMKFDKISL